MDEIALTGLRVRGEAAQANYDGELVKALQMALSMGRNVAGSGYDLWQARGYGDIGEFHAVRVEDSFDATIHRPDILPLSEIEQLELEAQKAGLSTLIANGGQPSPQVPISSGGAATQNDPERQPIDQAQAAD